MQIRQATIQDCVQIAELSKQLGYETSSSLMKDRLNKIIKDSDHTILIANDDNEVLGWIHAFFTLRVETDPFVEIGGLVVSEIHRNKGVGKLLVDAITEWAKTKPCDLIRVRSNTIRIESHVFYKQLNFILKKEQKVYDKVLYPSQD
ncbi:MAG: GNAT family N-acetyltransferase [Bacteroidia bacterium]